MGLFDMLTGGSNNKNTTNRSYGNYSSGNNATMTYQCSCCGRRENVINVRSLSNNPCPARGRDSRGIGIPHDWRRL